MFITDQDYKVVIGEQALKVVSQVSPDNRRIAETEAIEEVAGYLRPKYDTDAIFTAAGTDSLPPYLHLLGGRKSALPLLKNAALPAAPSLAKLEKQDAACAHMVQAQMAASDFGALCRKTTAPMGEIYRQKNIFLTD